MPEAVALHNFLSVSLVSLILTTATLGKNSVEFVRTAPEDHEWPAAKLRKTEEQSDGGGESVTGRPIMHPPSKPKIGWSKAILPTTS